MPSYLSRQTLQDAVERLAICSAQSSFADYLIFKRALHNAKVDAVNSHKPEPTAVVTGTKSVPFVQAIEEFALRVPRGSADPRTIDNPYYLPFGSKRDKTLGYRTAKYPSNGSSDTVNRWQGRSGTPLVYIPGTSPKEFQFVTKTPTELRAFFLIKGAPDNFSGHSPRLLDTAIWWFRFTDLEPRFDREPSPDELTRGLCDDLDLTSVEIQAIFDQAAEQDEQESNAAFVDAGGDN